MKTLHFEITLAAPRQRVWEHLLQPAGYEAWTAAFSEGSHYEGSWDAGARIRFLGPGGQDGMVAEIAEHRPAEFVSIRHLGFIQAGKEDTTSEAVRAWAPCYENYHAQDTPEGHTLLRVAMDCLPDFEDYMNERWPLALARLKALCEAP